MKRCYSGTTGADPVDHKIRDSDVGHSEAKYRLLVARARSLDDAFAAGALQPNAALAGNASSAVIELLLKVHNPLLPRGTRPARDCSQGTDPGQAAVSVGDPRGSVSRPTCGRPRKAGVGVGAGVDPLSLTP